VIDRKSVEQNVTLLKGMKAARSERQQLCIKRHVLGLELESMHSKVAATTGEYGGWLTKRGEFGVR
jgi:hypothetical protein